MLSMTRWLSVVRSARLVVARARSAPVRVSDSERCPTSRAVATKPPTLATTV